MTVKRSWWFGGGYSSHCWLWTKHAWSMSYYGIDNTPDGSLGERCIWCGAVRSEVEQ